MSYGCSNGARFRRDSEETINFRETAEPHSRQMARCEQLDADYEVRVLEHGQWALRSWSPHFDVAWAMGRAQSLPVRIFRILYKDAVIIGKELIAELKTAPEQSTSMSQE